jgi:hypothetical protein
MPLGCTQDAGVIALPATWQGELTRAVIIGCVLLAFWHYSAAQVSSLSGELRYEHQYQDFLPEGGSLSTSLQRRPSFTLAVLGDLLSKRIFAYSFFTSLSADFGTSRTPGYEFSSTSYNWNTYNLIVNILPYYPAKLDVAVRENIYDIKSSYDFLETHGRTRQQEQRIALSVDQVPSLPTVYLSYVRNRSWAPVGEPSEQLSQQYAFSLSAAGSRYGSAGLSGTVSDITEQYSGFHERLATVTFTGSRQLSERHQVSVNSEYNRFTGYSNLSGSLGYAGIYGERFRVSSILSGFSYSNAFTLGRTAALSERLTYLPDRFFQIGMILDGSRGITRSSLPSGVQSYTSSSLGGTATLQHNRAVGSVSISNGLTLGYLVQEYIERQNTFTAGISNGVQLPVGMFSASGDYNFSYNSTENLERWALVGNNIGAGLSGTLPGQVRSSSNIRFRSDHYSGDISSFRDQRNLTLGQRFDGSYFYLIPFTVGAGGSVNWYMASIRGHTHSWHVSFSSPAFFTPGLFVSYVYTRNFDPYYRQESIDQLATLLYRWRALSFEGRLRQTTVPIRIREVWFSVSRAF